MATKDLTSREKVMAAIELAVISLVLLWRNRMYRGASMVGKG